MEFDLNKLWNAYIKEDSYASPIGFLEDEYNFTEIESNVVDTWRWGNHIEAVYQSPEGNLVGLSYRDASGDGEIDAFDMMAEFYPVEKKEITVVKYVRVDS